MIGVIAIAVIVVILYEIKKMIKMSLKKGAN
jgi:hypothetical protein